MANNNTVRSTQSRRSNSYNNAGACAVCVLQLLGSVAVIGLGVVAYILEGRLKYYGIPIWSGSLFFFTAVSGFYSTRKTMCGIWLFLVTSVLTTVVAAGLLVLFARLLSLSGRYSFCDMRDSITLMCMHYTTLNTLMIVEACTLGVFALVLTTGAVGLGLCLCGLWVNKFGRTSAAPSQTAGSTLNIVRTDASMNLNFFSHEIATPTAPPEYIVAEEQLGY